MTSLSCSCSYCACPCTCSPGQPGPSAWRRSCPPPPGCPLWRAPSHAAGGMLTPRQGGRTPANRILSLVIALGWEMIWSLFTCVCVLVCMSRHQRLLLTEIIREAFNQGYTFKRGREGGMEGEVGSADLSVIQRLSSLGVLNMHFKNLSSHSRLQIHTTSLFQKGNVFSDLSRRKKFKSTLTRYSSRIQLFPHSASSEHLLQSVFGCYGVWGKNTFNTMGLQYRQMPDFCSCNYHLKLQLKCGHAKGFNPNKSSVHEIMVFVQSIMGSLKE